MTTKRKKKSRLVCPKTYRGKKVRSSKGVCHIVLASGKKKRVRKVKQADSSHRTIKRSAKARGMSTKAYRSTYGRHSPPGTGPVDRYGRDSYEQRIAREWNVDPETGSSRHYGLRGKKRRRR